MSKRMTPAMEKLNRKGTKESSLAGDAWKRLKRNKLAMVGLVVILIFVMVAIFANLIAPYGFDEQNFGEVLQTPSSKHIMGTDNLGRDIFSRIVYGTRISIPVGLLCVVVSMLIGGGLGVIAAYYGGRQDNIIMRIMDVFQSIPGILFAMAIIAALGNGIGNLVVAIAISMMPACARTCRAAIISVKENEYIMAAKTVGAGSIRQMLKYMLPNAVGPIIVTATFMVATDILIVSALSYLGLGIIPPTPEWGSMLAIAKDYMREFPHMIIFPGVMIMVTVFAINIFGDGLRDALDPRLK